MNGFLKVLPTLQCEDFPNIFAAGTLRAAAAAGIATAPSRAADFLALAPCSSFCCFLCLQVELQALLGILDQRLGSMPVRDAALTAGGSGGGGSGGGGSGGVTFSGIQCVNLLM